jgi:hypothetical protein
MQRRSFLRAVGVAGVLGTAGCIGGGSELVANTARTITVEPGTGWITEIPDVSGSGGAISYTADCRRRFDVYFFVGETQVERYRSFVEAADDGGTPPATTGDLPVGNRDVGQTAVSGGGDRYRAATADDGARQPIDESGPYYFVLDHSAYPAGGGAYPDDLPEPRSIHLDLTVTKSRFGL